MDIWGNGKKKNLSVRVVVLSKNIEDPMDRVSNKKVHLNQIRKRKTPALDTSLLANILIDSLEGRNSSSRLRASSIGQVVKELGCKLY